MYCLVLRKINTTDQSNVRVVEDGVCGFYATLHTEYRFHIGDIGDTVPCIQWPLALPGGKAIV